MNNKIEILDELTINKIAAGEVVEAPYSVVKELIENSIDANATIITLEIRDGGKKYIRITDNGVGIEEKYVEQAFMRHSTSKITNINDLNTINSLGFRGEALASIAAVSQVEMITRTKNQEYGILIEIIGGKIETIKKVGCPVGTTIIIKNLFFNTPARLKFMKSNSAETMQISRIITRLSLSNSKISFKYINNNKVIFTTPGNNILSETILSVFDKDTFKNLIFLENRKLNMKLEGYISQPNFVRGNRNLQIIYINSRYVKNKIISKAIEDAYKEKVVINRYPICILNLTIKPTEIDVNVHPAKTEVKFEKEDLIYEFVYRSIIKVLKESAIIPKLLIKENKNIVSADSKSKSLDNNLQDISQNINRSKSNKENILINENNHIYTEKSNLKGSNHFIDIENTNNEQIKFNTRDEDTIQSSFLNTLLNQYKIIGQLFNTYIILEKEDSIYLIDQHAAHERLLYNRFLEEIRNKKVVSQRLLEVEVLDLSNEDYILLSTNIDIFRKLGFNIEDFGVNTVIIREVPMILGKAQNLSFIYEILDEVRKESNIANHFESTIIKRACKEAIKANDKLDHYEIKQLIEELNTLTPPLTCPHGRPIILTMRQYDIEKHFKRIQ